MKVARNIYREKNGSGYRYRVIVSRTNGKKEYEFFPDGTPTRDMQKRQERARIEQKIAAKEAPFSSSLANVSFVDDVDQYLAALEATAVPGTVADARKDLAIWATYAGNGKRPRTMMSKQEWLSAWTHLIKVRKVAQSSANKYVSRLIAFYNWCNDRDGTEGNPARKLPRFKLERVPRAVDYETLGQLAVTFRRDTLNRRHAKRTC